MTSENRPARLGSLPIQTGSAKRERITAVRQFWRRHGWSYAFILPSMLTFTVFVLVPVVWSFVICT